MREDSSGSGLGDAALRDYESRLHSACIWDMGAIPALKSYLDEAHIPVNFSDPQFAEFLRIDLRFRVQRVKPNDPGAVLVELTKQFSEIPASLIRDLAHYEWQLRKNAGHHIDAARFVQNLKCLGAQQCEELASELAESPAAGQQESVIDGSTLAHAPAGKLRGGQIIGPYTIVEWIGGGGMGDVYKAQRQLPFRMDVAIKVVRSDRQTQRILNRFAAERQALAMMDHPNIARVFDAGVTDSGSPYFAMEYVEGSHVTSFCDKHRLPLKERLALFVQACRAIQHAHQKGIIHRDIKPSNILVARADAGYSVKVIDFGLARAVAPDLQLAEESHLTSPGQILGTLRYMSPEQTFATSQQTDVRSDVYSLGIVLYELLTGTTPFDDSVLNAKSLDQILSAIRSEDPARPSVRICSPEQSVKEINTRLRDTDSQRLVSILRGDLDWIVMRALEKDPNRRYESAAHFAEDMERFLAGQPVHARPPSITYKVQKTLRRHKAVSAVVATLLIFAFVTAIQSYHARIAQIEAEAKIAQEGQEKAAARAEAAEMQMQATEAEKQTEIALREKTLQALLTDKRSSMPDRALLTAIREAKTMDFMDEVSRVELQLEELSVLHRLQKFSEIRQLLPQIKPLTPQQEGKIEFWKILKAATYIEQTELARKLLEKGEEVELAESDRRFLECLLLDSRGEVLQSLRTLVREFPQYEPARELLLILMLLEGATAELDKQIEESRLLFPGNVYVELTACFSHALRGERDLAFSQLRRTLSAGLISDHDEPFFHSVLDLILMLEGNLTSVLIDSESGEQPGALQLLFQLTSFLASVPEAPAVMQDAFGTAFAIGRPPDSASELESGFLSELTTKVALASFVQRLGNNGPMIDLISEMERRSPVPGDALFLSTRGLMRLEPNQNFAAALEELDPATAAPCVFPRLRQQIIYEAAMCHMGLYLEDKDHAHLAAAGEFALQLSAMPNATSKDYQDNVFKILRLAGLNREALAWVGKCHLSSEEQLATGVKVATTATSLSEIAQLVELSDKLLARESELDEMELELVRRVRGEELEKLSMFVNSQSNDGAANEK